MISPTPPRNFAASLVTSASAKFRWGAGRIILPAFLPDMPDLDMLQLETSMLYLTRRTGEAVIINNAIEVRVVELKGKSVKLGFTFPADATVLREEVFLQIKAENEAAANASIEALRGMVRPARPEPDDG